MSADSCWTTEGKFALGGLAALALWLFLGLPELLHPEDGERFLGLKADAWIAIGTFALTGVTLFLGVVALRQLKMAQEDSRNNRTLVAVDRYDFDPVLDRCLRRLRKAYELKEVPIRGDVVTLLNYLEAIAIGIEQGVYDPELAAEHMKHIVVHSYERYLGPNGPELADFGPTNYIPLKRLYTKWSQT
jgi:hypothetical protein